MFKKVLYIIIINFLLITNLYAYETAKELAEKEKGIAKVACWIMFNIDYKDDLYNYWQKSEETLKLRTGDCEDMAILFYDTIKYLGYKPKLITLKISQYSKKGHAVCVFKNKNGYWQGFDTEGLDIREFDTIKELISKTYWGSTYFEEVDPKYK